MTTSRHTSLLIGLLGIIFWHPAMVNAAENQGPPAQAAIHVEVTGSGRPMILIPGLSCGGNVWDGTVAHFKETYQCHVVTLAGFAGQPAIGEPFLPQVREALMKYIRDQKMDRPVIVGHSLGGFLAYWLAAEAPDQIGPIIAVDGVPYYPALLDPSATPQTQQATATMFRNALKTQSAAEFAFNNQFILATMITSPKDLAMVARQSNQSDPKAVGQAFYEMMTTDLRDRVKAIQSPVLLLGATDPAASPEAQAKEEEAYRAQVATIPKHHLVFAPKSRHFIQLDAPDFFYQEADSFLQGAYDKGK